MSARKQKPAVQYSDEIAAEICERIAEGEPLKVICRSDTRRFPDFGTVYDWVRRYPDFAAALESARDIGADAIAEEALEIIDENPATMATEFGPRIDPAHVQWAKNRAEQRLKLLAKWHPKKYGEKIQQEITGKMTLAQLIESAQSAARDEPSGD